jgi:hypothetical protein
MKSNSAIWFDPPVLTPERKLWRAVLGQAYADAQLPPYADGEEPGVRASARAFLRADGSLAEVLLKDICESAAVPFDRVVLWARKQYPLAA